MKKDFLFPVLVLFFFAVTVYSALASVGSVGIWEVNLTAPVNYTWNNNGTIYFKFNVTANQSSSISCTLYHDISQAWGSEAAHTNSTVFNGTEAFFVKTGIADNYTQYTWNVGCQLGGEINTTVMMDVYNRTVREDQTAPVPRMVGLGNSNWTINRSFNFRVNVTESNPEVCLLQTSLDNTSGGTQINTSGALANNTDGYWNLTAKNASGTPYTNATAIFFHWGFEKSGDGVQWLENNTGSYKWNVACNDSAGNIGRFPGGNQTFFVDVTPPGEPNITSPLNFTKMTDLTPLIKWLNATTGSQLNLSNFSKYVLQVDNDSDFSSLYFQRNITDGGINYSLVTTSLTKDVSWYLRVSSYDLAGNVANSTLTVTYRTDGVCADLITGWNICAFTMVTAQNASRICDDVGCTYISKYNRTHEFQTYTSGATANAGMLFNASYVNDTYTPLLDAYFDSVVLIYVESNKTWGNKTAEVDSKYFYMNLTNASTGYNLVPVMNQTGTFTFGKFDWSINGNGTMVFKANNSKFMSFYVEENATGYKYNPFVSNRTYNNNTIRFKYGEVVWVHINKSIPQGGFLWNSSGEIW